MCSLTRNYTESCRYPYKILKECKDVLPLELLAQLKRVLHHYSPTKFVGHIAAEQLRQDHACGNHTSVSNDIPKVESTLNKEEHNTCVAVFPCWLEQLFPDLWLTPQGLICNEVESDRLFFDGSFLEKPFFTYIKQCASTSDEIEPHYDTAMTRYLVHTCNMRTSCPVKEILLFDEDASGAFRHANLHPRVVIVHACSVG